MGYPPETAHSSPFGANVPCASLKQEEVQLKSSWCATGDPLLSPWITAAPVGAAVLDWYYTDRPAPEAWPRPQGLVNLSVDQSTDEVAEFFEEELHKRWFEFVLTGQPPEASYRNQFSSADLQITINAHPAADDAGQSTVRISIKHPASARVPTSLSSVRAD